MDTLEKLGIGNVPPPAKNTRPILVSDYNTLVDKINEIIQTPVLESTSILLCTKTQTIAINVAETTIAGSTFTPPITLEPSIIDTYIAGSRVTVSNGYVANGDYYDILIAATEEELTNLKINVLCKNI